MNNRSIKQLIKDLIINQFNSELHDRLKFSENNIKLIEKKIWNKILIKKSHLINKDELFIEIDNNLSNIIICNQNNFINNDLIKNFDSKIIDKEFIMFIPLFILNYEIIKYYYKYKHKNNFILDVLYIILNNLNLNNMNYWNDLNSTQFFNSNFLLKLDKIILNEIKVVNNFIFDFIKDLSSFSSIIFKNYSDYNDFWFNIYSDFNLVTELFKYSVINKNINNFELFENKDSKISNFETEISNNINNIANDIFNVNRNDNNYQINITSNEYNKENIIASFMGSENEELPVIIEENNINYDLIDENNNLDNVYIDINNNFDNNNDNNIDHNNDNINNNSIIINNNILNNIDNKSYNYFTNLSNKLKKNENIIEYSQNNKFGNLSKIKLPSLLTKISKRKIIEYNKKYIGVNWDEQYLSKNKSNKIFNESILNVLTTERVKNCEIIIPNIKNNNYIWININSILRLFQGLPSIEFDLFPKYYKNKTIDYSDIYTFQLNDNFISIKLNENYGELCPWMNNHGKGVKYVFNINNGIKNNLNNVDSHNGINNNISVGNNNNNINIDNNKYILLSRDLINNICIYGTKVYYFKSLIELLITICNKIDNNKKSQDTFNKYDLFDNLDKENIISIKILKSNLLEFFQIYNQDIDILFNQLLFNNNDILNKVDTSININILLNIFLPIFEMFIQIFHLKSASNNNWKLYLGYVLLSNIYYTLWQFQINDNWMINLIKTEMKMNLINLSIYTSNHILYILYKNIQQELFKYQLNYIDNNTILDELKLNHIYKESIFNSIINILKRIYLIKNIYNKKIDIDSIYNLTDNNSQELSIFFSEKNELLNNNKSFKSNENEVLIYYLINDNINFQYIYDVYYNYLDQVYNWIIENKFNIKYFINIYFIISNILQDEILASNNMLNINLFDYLKNNILSEYKNNDKLFNKHIDSIIWINSDYNVFFKQLENYNKINYIKKNNNLLKFIISININLFLNNNITIITNNNINIVNKNVNNGEIEILNNYQSLFIQDENIVLNKLLQLLTIIDILLNKYFKFKNLINRLILYIWCRKNTRDFNLYIKFSNGYLYDSFSMKLMDFFVNIENNINFTCFNFQRLLDYIIILLNRFNSMEFLDNQLNRDYFIKWKIFKRYFQGKLYFNLNMEQMNFLNSLISLIYQICLISSDIISYFDSFVIDIPKRPSTFSSSKIFDLSLNNNKNNNNILLNFINQWKNNNLNNKINKLINTIFSLKKYINENKFLFNIENNYLLYYLY